MIHFGCPACRSSLETAEDKAGSTVSCPTCGQAIIVPAFRASNKPLPAILLPEAEEWDSDAGEAPPARRSAKVPGSASRDFPPEESKRVTAGIFALLLGSLGIHKFVLGYTTEGIIMLVVSVGTCGLGAIPMGTIALVEGILYLSKSDSEFVNTYQLGRRGWF